MYVMHLIKLWTGYWVKLMSKINRAVGENNRIDTSLGRKRPVHTFTKNEFWKFIVYILSTFNFRVKGHQIWVKPESYVSNKGITPLQTPLHRDFHGKIDSLNIWRDI